MALFVSHSYVLGGAIQLASSYINTNHNKIYVIIVFIS